MWTLEIRNNVVYNDAITVDVNRSYFYEIRIREALGGLGDMGKVSQQVSGKFTCRTDVNPWEADRWLEEDELQG